MALTDAHSQLLTDSAIDLAVAEEAGVRSVGSKADLPSDMPFRDAGPGIVFPWRPLSGETVLQYRPDKPPEIDGEPGPKYVFQKGIPSPLWVHPRMDDTTRNVVVIVEGTKQHLAAVSAAPEGVFLVGMAGCNGWSTKGAPTPDLAELPIDSNKVVLVFDADMERNRNVWNAAEKLGSACTALGATSVCFARIPAGATTGLDDYLATMPPERRTKAFATIIESAPAKLPRRPAKSKPKPRSTDSTAELFNKDGLRVVAVVDEFRKGQHHALGLDGSIWTYKSQFGIYQDDEHALVGGTRDLLGDRWRQSHHNNVMALVAAELAAENLRLPDAPFGTLVAVTNGMLDPLTGELHRHHPNHLAYARLSIPWDPSARCPKFDSWLEQRCGQQADDLLEALGLVLTPDAAQRKVPFLIGPTRSGKGTVIRVLEAIVGSEHVSAATLHQLSANRFASADLVGKVLNSAGDLSDRHIEDLAMFKAVTGNDTVAAERKFRDAFTFRNTALFVFSANTPPTVSETSRAYMARMRPYLFPFSYENHEDPHVERELLGELPGVLVRLVEAVQRWHARGGYTPVNPIVADLFARQSDPVAMFVAEVLEHDETGFVSTADLHDSFSRWAELNRRSSMGRNKFLARADNAVGAREREHANGTGRTGWRGWTIRPELDWSDETTSYALAEPHIRSVTAGSAGSVHISPREGLNESSEPDVIPVPSWEKEGPEPAEPAEAGDLFDLTDPVARCPECGGPKGSFGTRCPDCAREAVR